MIVELSPKRAIDFSKSADLMRYANHSCRPDARLSIAQGRVEFYLCVQPIAHGDEITVNYGGTHHQGRLVAFALRQVATGGCKGTISDDEDSRLSLERPADFRRIGE
jgi:SET domain-containing protein